MPSTSTALNSTSRTSPLPRETNHSHCEPDGRGCGRRHSPSPPGPPRGMRHRLVLCQSAPRRPRASRPRCRTAPSWATRRAGSAVHPSQSSASSPATMAAVDAPLASAQLAGGDAGGAPGAVRRETRPRVHDVVEYPTAAPPTAADHRRGRDGAGGEPDDLGGRGTGRAVVVGDEDGPAVTWRLACDCDVASQADEHPAAVPQSSRAPPLRPCLRRAPSPLLRGRARTPAGRWSRRPSSRADRQPGRPGRTAVASAGGVDGGEVSVVAEGDERPAHRRIHQAVRPSRRRQRRPRSLLPGPR